jgi:hypothetical protein
VWGHEYVITSLLENAVSRKIKRGRPPDRRLTLNSSHSRPRAMSAPFRTRTAPFRTRKGQEARVCRDVREQRLGTRERAKPHVREQRRRRYHSPLWMRYSNKRLASRTKIPLTQALVVSHLHTANIPHHGISPTWSRSTTPLTSLTRPGPLVHLATRAGTVASGCLFAACCLCRLLSLPLVHTARWTMMKII